MSGEEYLTTAVFEQHQKHVDSRFDSVDSRFDAVNQSLIRIEAALIAQGIKQDSHQHNTYVRWPIFIAVLVAVLGAMAGIAAAVVQAVS